MIHFLFRFVICSVIRNLPDRMGQIRELLQLSMLFIYHTLSSYGYTPRVYFHNQMFHLSFWLEYSNVHCLIFKHEFSWNQFMPSGGHLVEVDLPKWQFIALTDDCIVSRDYKNNNHIRLILESADELNVCFENRNPDVSYRLTTLQHGTIHLFWTATMCVTFHSEFGSGQNLIK